MNIFYKGNMVQDGYMWVFIHGTNSMCAPLCLCLCVYLTSHSVAIDLCVPDREGAPRGRGR